jgi:hypothetical protein
MPAKFYLPTFLKLCLRLKRFLDRHQKDLIELNTITNPELGQVTALASALDAIVGPSTTWPNYREGI